LNKATADGRNKFWGLLVPKSKKFFIIKKNIVEIYGCPRDEGVALSTAISHAVNIPDIRYARPLVPVLILRPADTEKLKE
jgi:hypothetical protein